jgi:aromatic-amino-acid transaminase
MLETLKPAAPDKILEIMGLFRGDPRDDKLDLGVGVYKDAEGRTPVMRAVKAAEARLLEEQESKAYVGVLGDLGFVASLGELALGGSVPQDRLSGAQTPGGTGAIRQLFELIRRANPGGRSGCPTRPGRTTRRSSAISACPRAATATSTRRRAGSISRE